MESKLRNICDDMIVLDEELEGLWRTLRYAKDKTGHMEVKEEDKLCPSRCDCRH